MARRSRPFWRHRLDHCRRPVAPDWQRLPVARLDNPSKRHQPMSHFLLPPVPCQMLMAHRQLMMLVIAVVAFCLLLHLPRQGLLQRRELQRNEPVVWSLPQSEYLSRVRLATLLLHRLRGALLVPLDWIRAWIGGPDWHPKQASAGAVFLKRALPATSVTMQKRLPTFEFAALLPAAAARQPLGWLVGAAPVDQTKSSFLAGLEPDWPGAFYSHCHVTGAAPFVHLSLVRSG